jgi:Protein of unknown function (DUF1569)
MSTLAQSEVAIQCNARVDRLDPNTPPRWGRMTAPQMVCHLNDSFKVASGDRTVSRAPVPVPRSLIRWIALRTPLPWAHNLPTRPEIKQGTGGTPPGNWDQDRQELRALILSFPSRLVFAPHPIFGPMSKEDWQIWAYRHVDHHLRQFGV